jgi:hypothetical protein
MALELLGNGQDDWNDIFLAWDFDGNENQLSEAESGSDYDDTYQCKMPQSDSEDEMDKGPAIELHNTQMLRDKWWGKCLVEPVKYILGTMDHQFAHIP